MGGGGSWDDDRRLAKRLAREARTSARASAYAEAAQARAVRRRTRRIARARRALPVYGGTLAASAGLLAATGLDTLAGGLGFVAVLGAFRSVAVLIGPPPPSVRALPAAQPAAAPPPDPRSAAWPAVRRLEAVRQELVRLLPLVAPAGRAAAEEAWHAAAESDAALRWQAARLAAVEPHRGADAELLRPLFTGVEAQERLVTAVADLVAASADPRASARLQDATDALHGLAQGLREVR